MDENEYVSIQEAAQRCGVNGKTIQRAIRAGKLPARYPKPNRCEIAVSDLETFRPGQVSGHTAEPVESRIAALEKRVLELEQQVSELQPRQMTRSTSRHRKSVERTKGPLPKHLVSLLAFAGHHNVAESKVLAAIDMGMLPVKRGEWTDADSTVVKEALDAKGRHAFYRIYHGVPPFVECKQCPH
jgi:hypothetical protein